MSVPCGSVVVAAVRLQLDGQHQEATDLVNSLHDCRHATFAALELVTAAVRCLDRVDPGHGTQLLEDAGLAHAEGQAS